MSDVSLLNVKLYGEPIGTLTRVGGDRIIFAFNDDYTENPDRPILSLGFKDQLGELITGFRPTQTRLMPFFSNLLPEGHMRSYLAERAGINTNREFFLLWVLGQDLPGAVTIEPSEDQAWPEDHDQGDNEDDHDDHHDHALRFSLAGVQLKFSAVNEARGGLTIPARGVGGDWIVKLPSRDFSGVPENEFSMLTLAGRIGIDVPEINLVDLTDIEGLPEGLGRFEGKAFAIKRFDRSGGEDRIHIEDFAQIFGVYPEDKYKKASARSIASVLAAETSESDIAEFIRRLTFNVLIGNADMHLKNWSVRYLDPKSVSLAPAYDFVSTIPYIPDSKAALNVSRTKRFDEFNLDELSHLAAKARLPSKLVRDTAIETAQTFLGVWQEEKRNLTLHDDVIRVIDKHLGIVPLMAEAR
ncbi:MAG: HipA domain-containing protein [Rhodospirillales bacterium]